MYYRLIIDSEQLNNQQIYLKVEQLHYLERVIRLKLGDRFIAMDGQGNSWLASLQGSQALILETLVIPVTELPWRLTLVTAIVKGDGFADIVRCCTELGVSEIIPTLTTRTVNKPSSHKVERWRKIAQEAVEQSERQIVPHIFDPISFTEVLKTVIAPENNNYICLARGTTPHLVSCLNQLNNNHLVVATGPEGGWTAQEIEAAIASGCQEVNLGQRILRAVTAPIAVSALVAGMSEKNRTNLTLNY